MKSGITRKLIFYFMAVIMVFTLILVVIFNRNYQSQTKSEVETQLLNESRHLVEIIETNGTLMFQRQTLDDVLGRLDLKDVQIWFIDREGDIEYLTDETMGMGMMRSTRRLSQTTQDIVVRVLSGEQVVTEAIRGVMSSESLTVGSPVTLDGTIAGGLFVAASISSISEVSASGLSILFRALVIALILAVLLGYFLSLNFIRPLNQAADAIGRLAQGHYDVHFTSHKNDEIGQLTQNIETLSHELGTAKEAEANLEKMRQNFISDITHELRTPVTIIRGLAEGIQDQVYTGDAIQTASKQIIAESLDMQRLINDLLELSKLEDPDFKVDKQAFEWHELLQDVSRSAGQLISQKKQILETHIDEGLWNGLGDTQRLKQMFLAVIDNACKFSPEASLIMMNAKVTGKTLVIQIRDQGQGMTKEQREELFHRYKKDSKNNPTGNGLGLLIVSKIAQKHAIAIEVESSEDKGTTFIFNIDL